MQNTKRKQKMICFFDRKIMFTIIAFVFLLFNPAQAGYVPLVIEEEGGSPSVRNFKKIVLNGATLINETMAKLL